MVIVYDSLTGQTKRFVTKLGIKAIDINDYYETEELVFLITRSFNFGEIPKSTSHFLDEFSNKVVGTAVSGNRNWGTNYGKAGDHIERIYKIPLILKFEGSGFDKDVEFLKDWFEKYKGEVI